MGHMLEMQHLSNATLLEYNSGVNCFGSQNIWSFCFLMLLGPSATLGSLLILEEPFALKGSVM